MMKHFAYAAAIAAATTLATSAVAAPEKYMLDASHSQVLFSYNHLGYSTTWNMFSGFEGEIMFDQEDPSASSVNVSMPLDSLFTGWEGRFNHFMSPDFFDAKGGETITFASTGIEVTGDDTAKIMGDLTVNGMTKSVTLDAKLNQTGDHPMKGKAWAGFDASTTILRSDFGLGNFAPAVSDEIEIMISIEAEKAE